MSKKTDAVLRRLHGHALTFPGAWDDAPWDDPVVKVGKKIFVFLGPEGTPDPAIAVKIPESAELALGSPSCSPTGYGLGRAGWVSVGLNHRDCPSVDVLCDWIDESYRNVALKKLVAELDARTPT